MNEKIKIGIITGTIGTDGTIFIDDTLKSMKALSPDCSVYIGFTENFAKEYHVVQANSRNKGFTLKLRELTSKEESIKFKEQAVFTYKESIITKKSDGYLPEDIKNCIVYNIKTGKKIGKIIDEINLPSNDVWVIESEGQEVLIPVIDDIVKKINLRTKRIEINVIPGLLEANLKINDEDNDG
jgi:16S rRNA processing protein RimM